MPKKSSRRYRETPRTLLVDARGLITKPDAWTRDALARGADGATLPYSDPRARRFCLEGAIRRAASAGTSPEVLDTCLDLVRNELRKAGYFGTIQGWNDRNDHLTVLRLLDAAIANA